MLKRLVNEVQFTITIETLGPFLVKDGRYDKKWSTSHLDSVFISSNDEEKIKKAVRENDFLSLNFYIPGTSLRGVIRSHAEKIVRTLWENDSHPICCDPFATSDKDYENNNPMVACSKWLNEKEEEKHIGTPYKYSCVICKLFGSTAAASRIQVHDGAVVTPGNISVRDGIGIDRFTSGVSTGPFQNMVLEGFTFRSEITIRNFELWQLGLLAYVFRDFELERLCLGFGKSKGFGRVKGTLGDITLTYCSREAPKKLQGIAEILNSETIEKYGFVSLNSEEYVFETDKIDSELYWHKYPIKMDHSNGGITQNPFWKICAKIYNETLKKDENGQCKFKTIPQLREEIRAKIAAEKAQPMEEEE